MRSKRLTKTIIAEFVAVFVGVLLVLFGLDLFSQCEEVQGRIIGESRHEQFVTTQFGSHVKVHESNVVEYFANGKTWIIKLPKKQKGSFVRINFYSRWPILAWVGGPYVGPVMVGLAASFCLGFGAMADWVRRARWKSQFSG